MNATSKGAASLRQQQLLDQLDEAVRLGESPTAARLATLMLVRHDVGRSQTYDMLGALQKKGLVTLRGREWHRGTDADG
jgi:hypothetical protein